MLPNFGCELLLSFTCTLLEKIFVCCFISVFILIPFWKNDFCVTISITTEEEGDPLRGGGRWRGLQTSTTSIVSSSVWNDRWCGLAGEFHGLVSIRTAHIIIPCLCTSLHCYSRTIKPSWAAHEFHQVSHLPLCTQTYFKKAEARGAFLTVFLYISHFIMSSGTPKTMYMVSMNFLTCYNHVGKDLQWCWTLCIAAMVTIIPRWVYILHNFLMKFYNNYSLCSG